MTGFYLYGFTNASQLEQTEFGVAGQALQIIRHANLSVIAEAVNLETFKTELESSAENPQWIAARALRHDAVISSFLNDGVIPLRFGTLLPDREALEGLLERSSEKLNQRLLELAGKREFSVRVWLERNEIEPRLLETIPELDDLQAEINGATPGRAHLMKRRLNDELERHLRTHLNEFRAIAFDRLAEAVDAIVPLERLPKSDGANSGLLEAAVLLDALKEAMLRGELGGWVERFAMKAELSGPFAPYNFVIDPNRETE